MTARSTADASSGSPVSDRLLSMSARIAANSSKRSVVLLIFDLLINQTCKSRSSSFKVEPVTVPEILNALREAGSTRNIEGMARYNIRPAKVFGVPQPVIQQLARKIGRNSSVGVELWDTGIHEARLLALLLVDPLTLTECEIDRWVYQFDSWALCDSTCLKVIAKTPFAWAKTAEYVKSDLEYVRRAGLALIAALAIHDKKASPKQFAAARKLVATVAADKRVLIRKASRWALRQMDKRERRPD